MANQKLTQLAALGAEPSAVDLLYMVDDPSGSATSKKMTVGNLISMVEKTPGAARLGAAVSSGTTFTTRTALSPSYRGVVVLSPFTAAAEVRTVTAVSGVTATVSVAIANSHSADGAILLMYGAPITPEMLGAAADGTTDDGAVFEALCSVAAPVQLTAGRTYRITSAFEVTAAVTVRGHGATMSIDANTVEAKASGVAWEGVTFYHATGAQMFVQRAVADKLDNTGWIFRDCLFDGVSVYTQRLGATLNTGGTVSTGSDFLSDVLFDNCEMKDTNLSFGFRNQGTHRVTWRNCHIHNGGTSSSAGDGIKISAGAVGCTVDGCHIHDWTRDGIDFFDSLDTTIRGCHVYDNGVEGIEGKWDSDNDSNSPAWCVIEGCYAYGNGTDGIVCGYRHGVVANNHAYGNGQHGIHIKPDTATVSTGPTPNLIVSGNHAYANGSTGIRLQSDNCTCSGNVCWNQVAGPGIYLVDGDNVTITGNACYDDQGTATQTYGILIDNSSDNVIVALNTVGGNATADILVNTGGSGHVVVKDNPGYENTNGIAFTDLDATPFVGVQNGYFRAGYSSSTNITGFDGGHDGDIIYILHTAATPNVVYVHGGTMQMKGATNYTPVRNELVAFVRRSGNWYGPL